MKGKAAAQAANRRAQEAQERVAELETKLREQEQRHRTELRELREERDQVRNRLTREVDALARAAIARAEAAAMEEVAEYRGRIVGGFKLICDNIGGPPVRQTGTYAQDVADCIAELAKVYGIPAGDLLAAADVAEHPSRGARRRTNDRTRRLASEYRERAQQ